MRWYNFLWIGFWWIIFGTLVLPIYILKDIIYFYKINCFDGTVTATEAKKIHREERKLKIEHLNNIYEVMRGIFIEMNRKRKKDKVDFKKNQTLQFDKVKQMDWEEGSLTKYNISMSLIIKIWRRYNEKDVGDIFKDEPDPLLPLIDDTKIIPKNRKFRRLVGSTYMELIEKNLLNVSNMDINNPDRKILEDDDYEFDNEEDQLKLNNVKSFLMRFRDVNSEGDINLLNALKSLPKKITLSNLERVELMNQSVIQVSIIAFQNDDKDELFNFYDKRGKKRLMKVRSEMDEISNSISTTSNTVIGLIEKVSEMFNIQLDESKRFIRSGSAEISESASEFV